MLTIDVDLQRKVEEALRKGMEAANSKVGVVIAMDPRTGEVLTMVSLPAYDNNLFSGGISFEDYERLSTDRTRPLINHAISGQYPPGSTFKVVPAATALEAGAISPNTRVTCNGTMYLPNKFFPNDPKYAQRFYCWRKAGHGSLNVVGALMHSCNIFSTRRRAALATCRAWAWSGWPRAPWPSALVSRRASSFRASCRA